MRKGDFYGGSPDRNNVLRHISNEKYGEIRKNIELFDKIRANFVSLIDEDRNRNTKKLDFKGVIVADYPAFINVLVTGKGGSYLRSINKSDIYCGYCKLHKIR